MPDQIMTSQERHRRRELTRYLLGIAIGIVVLVLLFGKRGDLVAAWHQLGSVDLGWVSAAITAEALSLWVFAYLQHRVLRLSGSSVAMPSLFLLTLANDAIANTVPGEPAVSSAYRYRQYRRHGASAASAGWTIFTILVSQAIAMSALLLLGVIVALAASTTSGGAGIAVLGVVIILLAGAVLVRRDLVLRLAGALARGLQRITHRPAGLAARAEATVDRMREIPLSGRGAAAVVGLAGAVWCADLACLACSFAAVHVPVPWHGLLLAYGAAQVLASLPVVPGGIGIVEGSLAVILAAYGAGRGPALAVALVFRSVSFWLAIGIGWLSVAVIAGQARRRRELVPAALADATAGEAGASSPGH